jgi:hypothetical protein
MSRKWLLVSLVVALIVSLGFNAVLSTMLIDRALQEDDHARGREWDRETIASLRWMADRYGRFPDRAAAWAQMDVRFPEPKHVVKWDGDILWVDEVGLQYGGDSLQAIVLMNEVK